jgi:hypothetical protein
VLLITDKFSFRARLTYNAFARSAVPTKLAPSKVTFPLTIFLSAFLLFWAQLILGKCILPWFGGTPAVWTTCMLFFQVLLLGGYAYAHWLTERRNALAQGLIHCALLLIALVQLAYFATIWNSPITPGSSWKPTAQGDPAVHLIKLLGVSVGLPYFVLSATGPLLQAWFKRANEGSSPYRLYSVSNLGSFLALFAFPILFEPHLILRAQGRIWSAAYVLFAVVCAACAFRLAGTRVRSAEEASPSLEAKPLAFEMDAASPNAMGYFLWFGLPACASVVFLSTTNQLCQDIAVVPLLWILPLAVYLLSFILCFEHQRWYARNWFHLAFGLSLFASCFVLFDGAFDRIFVQIGIYLSVLFVVCMVCHGELARAKPHPRHLTSFYLAVAAGGALGGVFVGLLAPQIFRGFWEYQLGLWISACLLLFVLVKDSQSWLYRSPIPAPVIVLAIAALLPEAAAVAHLRAVRPLDHFPALIAAVLLLYVFFNRERSVPEQARTKAAPLCCAAAALVSAFVLTATGLSHAKNAIARYRNFYGTLAVLPQESDDPARSALVLVHGRISHGFQLRADLKRDNPTAYFVPNSGVGLAVRHAISVSNQEHRNVRLGVLGLGVGTLAAYGRLHDTLRFYEINPKVTEIASNRAYFTFLADSPATIQVIPGDARISLEREADRGELQNFDVLAIDAFSGDSIPVHLLTQEAVAVYLMHLRNSDGILAIHVTNTFLDLRPVVFSAASHFGLNSVWIHSGADGLLSSTSDWILLSRGELPRNAPDATVVDARSLSLPAIRPWTDDYSNLLQIIRH